MPGLIGKYSSKINKNLFIEALNMQVYDKHYVFDSLFLSENIIASRVHLNFIGEKQSPFSIDNTYVWIEGEIYNFDQLNKNCESFPELLLVEYQDNLLKDILPKIDGYFTAVIYDKNKNKIIVVTDRYGLKPIYYSFVENSFCWASEVKVFKKLLKTVSISESAVKVFSKLGYITGNITLFNEIKLLNASSILTYDIENHSHSIQRYWSWNYIKESNITFNEAVDKLYFYLKKSIEKRTVDGLRVGVTLSGGIDSRVLLSLLPNNNFPTVTWGIKNSIDRILAKKVTKTNKNKAYFFDTNYKLWFKDRIYGIWKTDGMFNLMHMHSSSYHRKIKNIFDVNLNGFAGDLNIGGGWIVNNNKRIAYDSAIKKIKDGVTLLDLKDDFYDINHEDPFFLDTRVRRFTIGGSIEMAKFIEQRKPFFDNSVMELMYSLPDEYRADGHLYYEMIRKYIPKLFNKIHTTHGLNTIAGNPTIFDKLKLKFSNFLIKTRINKEPSWSYSDYENWIRQPNFLKFVTNILLDSNTIISNYIDQDFIENIIKSHVNKSKNYCEEILAILTLEIWFQQFFNSKFIDFEKLTTYPKKD